MILVRHGLMLVGFPFSGKTMCYHALGAALGLVHDKVTYSLPTTYVDSATNSILNYHPKKSTTQKKT